MRRDVQSAPLREGRHALTSVALSSSAVFQSAPLREGRRRRASEIRRSRRRFNPRPCARGDRLLLSTCQRTGNTHFGANPGAGVSRYSACEAGYRKASILHEVASARILLARSYRFPFARMRSESRRPDPKQEELRREAAPPSPARALRRHARCGGGRLHRENRSAGCRARRR